MPQASARQMGQAEKFFGKYRGASSTTTTPWVVADCASSSHR
jgi:hypothetical protein